MAIRAKARAIADESVSGRFSDSYDESDVSSFGTKASVYDKLGPIARRAYRTLKQYPTHKV